MARLAYRYRTEAAAARAYGKTHGVDGNRNAGGWIYKAGRDRPLCQGWDVYADRCIPRGDLFGSNQLGWYLRPQLDAAYQKLIHPTGHFADLFASEPNYRPTLFPTSADWRVLADAYDAWQALHDDARRAWRGSRAVPA